MTETVTTTNDAAALRRLLETMPMDDADRVTTAISAGQLDPEDDAAERLARWIQDAAAALEGERPDLLVAPEPLGLGDRITRGETLARVPVGTTLGFEGSRVLATRRPDGWSNTHRGPCSSSDIERNLPAFVAALPPSKQGSLPQRYRVGYYCPRAEGHFELIASEDFDTACGGKGWDLYLDAEPGDTDLPAGEWV